MGMSYRAAMVPMISMVVGTVLTPTSVTDTVGMAAFLTFFFRATACVKRKASSAMSAAAAMASSHTPGRRESAAKGSAGNASNNDGS